MKTRRLLPFELSACTERAWLSGRQLAAVCDLGCPRPDGFMHPRPARTVAIRWMEPEEILLEVKLITRSTYNSTSARDRSVTEPA
jgi:hypothetical protein